MEREGGPAKGGGRQTEGGGREQRAEGRRAKGGAREGAVFTQLSKKREEKHIFVRKIIFWETNRVF